MPGDLGSLAGIVSFCDTRRPSGTAFPRDNKSVKRSLASERTQETPLLEHGLQELRTLPGI